MGKPVRMADIAEQLHISVVSVSKALAGKPGVSEEMRAKVVALARQMGYEGTKICSEAEGGNIGVLVADRFFAENTFYTNLYRFLVLSSGEKGLGCMMEIVSQEAERSAAQPALIAGRKVDAVVFMGNLAPAYLAPAADWGPPCLQLDFHLPDLPWDCVCSDNYEGGSALTRHLLSLGRRKIGFVGSILSTSSIMDRYLGYQRTLRLAGLRPREDWLLEDRDENGEFIPFDLPAELPEAFLCSCDEVAYNLTEALQKLGHRVPEDIAVCGYDDFRFAQLSRPPLTTYRVNVEQMAEQAVELLAQKIRKEPTPSMTYVVPGRLVVRDSTGAPPM